jgi:flagellar basal body-associated protein FliL
LSEGRDQETGHSNQTKVEGGLSLEELDAVIANEDPEFLTKIREIESDDAKSELNIDLIDLDQVLLEREGKTLKARLGRAKKYFHAKVFLLWVLLKNLAELTWQGILAGAKNIRIEVVKGVNAFAHWPTAKKVSFFAVAGLVLGTLGFAYRAMTRGWIVDKQHLFVRSLEEWSSEKVKFDPAQELEPFFDSARVAQNLFSLKRVVVNLRASESSGPNPMAAFEIFLEGNSTEVIVEVKDRESEIRDRIQRLIEEMTYDQLNLPDGKQILIEKLRRDVNKLVTSGQIRKIYIKTVVIKP